jgi:uncharacterized protein
MSQALPRIKSPCVNVCLVDPATRHCEGCARTLREIAQWSRLDDAERTAIMADLPNRKLALAAGARPQ